MDWKPLLIGVEEFERIIEENYYYIDKTELIKDILDKKGMVNLFTRPRRFGKTLNMSMLRCFFERGLEQIKEKRYVQEFTDDRYTYAICYGIGFYKKQVCVTVENIEIEDEK